MEFEEYRNEKNQLHRIDGPAYICEDHEEWFINGKLHRVDGPAIIYDDHQEWCINNKEVEPDDYIHEEIKDCIYGI